MQTTQFSDGANPMPRPQQLNLQQHPSSVVVRHTRTISIVSDSNLSYVTATGGSPIESPEFFPSDANTKDHWSIPRSPSASSFFSLVSEQFYDPFPEPEPFDEQVLPKTQSTMTSVATTTHVFDNKAFIDDGDLPYLPSKDKAEMGAIGIKQLPALPEPAVATNCG